MYSDGLGSAESRTFSAAMPVDMLKSEQGIDWCRFLNVFPEVWHEYH